MGISENKVDIDHDCLVFTKKISVSVNNYKEIIDTIEETDCIRFDNKNPSDTLYKQCYHLCEMGVVEFHEFTDTYDLFHGINKDMKRIIDRKLKLDIIDKLS